MSKPEADSPSKEVAVMSSVDTSGALQQYKLYVELADRVSSRRLSANELYITVNSVLATVYGIAVEFLETSFLLKFATPVVGVLVCGSWLSVIVAYRQLNSVKFQVIHEIEKELALPMFTREWEIAQRGRGKRYIRLTTLEKYLPITFALLYLVLLLFAMTS